MSSVLFCVASLSVVFEPNISQDAPNMNGAYLLSQTPGASRTQERFPSEYRKYPRGVESFDVYSPAFETRYSQVFWKGLDPVPLPADVVRRYAGRAMAVVGFEVDQVLVNGGEGGTELSVPMTHCYNHHFESTMVGAKSRLRKIRLDGPHDPRIAHLEAQHGHRLPSYEEHWTAEEIERVCSGALDPLTLGVTIMPTHRAVL